MNEGLGADDLVQDMQDDMLEDINADLLEKKKEDMDQYLLDMDNALSDWKQDKKVVNIGDFLVQITSTCEIDLPEEPEPQCPV